MEPRRNNSTATSVTRSQTLIFAVIEVTWAHDASYTVNRSKRKPSNGHERVQHQKDDTNRATQPSRQFSECRKRNERELYASPTII